MHPEVCFSNIDVYTYVCIRVYVCMYVFEVSRLANYKQQAEHAAKVSNLGLLQLHLSAQNLILWYLPQR